MSARIRTSRCCGLVLLLCLVGAACGGSESEDSGQAPVGQISQIKGDIVRVGGELVEARGHRLQAGSVITSNDDGGAIFQIDGRLRSCDFDSVVEITLLPRAQTLLQLTRGSLTCLSEESRDRRETFTVGEGEDVSIAYLDPLFNVTADEAGAEVWVGYGFVEVARGESRGLAGPGSVITVPEGEGPRPAEPFDRASLAPERLGALERLEAELPEPDLSAPEVGGSAALRKLLAGEFVLGLDDRASEPSGAFLTSLIDALARSWGGLDVEVRRLSHAAGSAAYGSGEIDAFLTPTFVDRADFFPLYEDEAGLQWDLWGPPDEGFQDAIAGFLRTILDHGIYADLHLQALGRVPDYEVLRSIVFPSNEQLAEGERDWRPGSEKEGADPSPAPAPQPDRDVGPTPRPSGLRVRDVGLVVASGNGPGTCPRALVLETTVTVAGAPGRIGYRLLDGTGSAATGSVGLESDGVHRFEIPHQVAAAGSRTLTLQIVDPPTSAGSRVAYSVSCDSPPPPPPPSPAANPVDEVIDELGAVLDNVLDGILALLGGL